MQDTEASQGNWGVPEAPQEVGRELLGSSMSLLKGVAGWLVTAPGWFHKGEADGFWTRAACHLFLLCSFMLMEGEPPKGPRQAEANFLSVRPAWSYSKFEVSLVIQQI